MNFQVQYENQVLILPQNFIRDEVGVQMDDQFFNILFDADSEGIVWYEDFAMMNDDEEPIEGPVSEAVNRELSYWLEAFAKREHIQ